MAETTKYAHGIHYGDLSGVNFYGPPINGLWLDQLSISDSYFFSLMNVLLDRELRPRIASDWNEMQGLFGRNAGIGLIPRLDAEEFVASLDGITAEELAIHYVGNLGECLDCAAEIQAFFRKRLTQRLDVYIEED